MYRWIKIRFAFRYFQKSNRLSWKMVKSKSDTYFQGKRVDSICETTEQQWYSYCTYWSKYRSISIWAVYPTELHREVYQFIVLAVWYKVSETGNDPWKSTLNVGIISRGFQVMWTWRTKWFFCMHTLIASARRTIEVDQIRWKMCFSILQTLKNRECKPQMFHISKTMDTSLRHCLQSLSWGQDYINLYAPCSYTHMCSIHNIQVLDSRTPYPVLIQVGIRLKVNASNMYTGQTTMDDWVQDLVYSGKCNHQMHGEPQTHVEYHTKTRQPMSKATRKEKDVKEFERKYRTQLWRSKLVLHSISPSFLSSFLAQVLLLTDVQWNVFFSHNI